MKNIIEILKEIGIEVSEDKVDGLTKLVAENYKTVAEFDKKIGKLTGDLNDAKEQLETAQTTLKGFEGVDLETMNKNLADWKKKAEDAKNDYEAKIAARDFEDALRTQMEGLKFSSNAAKKAVADQIRGMGLKLHEGKILGFEDAVKDISEKDPDAFVDEGNPPARFTTALGKQHDGKKYSSVADIIKIKDPVERQNAIAANPELFTKGE